ncbi:hypothetical protein [Bradyrhizobium diazoefficiens]
MFVVAAAAALFAAAGTVAIPGFWAYLAIFAVVMIVSFAALDPDLLRERMRPGGKKPPLALRVFSLVLFMHWIVAGVDRGRFHWSDNVPDWLQGVCLFTFAAGYVLGTMGHAREPVFLLCHSHPDRPRPARRHHGALRIITPRGSDGGSFRAFGESQTSLGKACCSPIRVVTISERKQASHV